jgi:hypothetical protein
MYTSTHSAVGILIMLTPLPLPLKVTLAIASHPIVDMFGEKPHDEGVPRDVVYLAFMLLTSLLTGNSFLTLAGILLGSLIDTIDKMILPALFGKKWTNFIHKSRFYPKVKWKLSLNATVMANGYSMLLVMFVLVGLFLFTQHYGILGVMYYG